MISNKIENFLNFRLGGPLLFLDNNIIFHVGIVSFGFACASNKPSVNTRVTSYLDWIQQNTLSTIYCIRWWAKEFRPRFHSFMSKIYKHNDAQQRSKKPIAFHSLLYAMFDQYTTFVGNAPTTSDFSFFSFPSRKSEEKKVFLISFREAKSKFSLQFFLSFSSWINKLRLTCLKLYVIKIYFAQ